MEKVNPEPSDEAKNLKPGIYQHFKGHTCQVIGVAHFTEDPTQEYVVYYHNRLWVRPLKMFLEEVNRDGYQGPRFRLLEVSNKKIDQIVLA